MQPPWASRCSPLKRGTDAGPASPQVAAGTNRSVASSGTGLGQWSPRHLAQRPGPHCLSPLRSYLQALCAQPLRAGGSRGPTGSPRRAGDTQSDWGAWLGVPRETSAVPPFPGLQAARQVQPSRAEPVRDASAEMQSPSRRRPAPPPLPLAHVAAYGAPAAGRQQRAEPVRLLGCRGAGRGAPRARLALGRRARQLGPRHPAEAHGGGGGRR